MINVSILTDSINVNNDRLTTFLLKYPRIIHCFNKDTEVLAKVDGYVKFVPFEEAFNNNYILASYNKDTEEILFEQPIAYICKEIDEELVEIDNQRISMSVTKDHKLLVGSRKSWGDLWETILARDLLTNFTQKRIKTYGYYQGKKIGLLSKLIGFFIGDGTIYGQKCVFHLKKQRKIDYLTNLLKELDIDYEIFSYEDGCFNIKFKYDLDLFKSCYNNDKLKIIPKIFHSSTKEDFEMLLDGMWNSDGSTDAGYLRIFNTFSKPLAEQLNALSSIYGMRINLTGPYDKCYKLTNCQEKNPIIRSDKVEVKLVPYKDNVYCATVSTGFLIVRRNGLVHISGNSDFMTHRTFSRNGSSSRARPVKIVLEEIKSDPFIPTYWGANNKGMSAENVVSPEMAELAKQVWLTARDSALNCSRLLMQIGIHKQLANRLTEAFSYITVVLTTTDLENFFSLRCHEDAQPEIQDLADEMLKAYYFSKPQFLEPGQWHIPFSANFIKDEYGLQEKLTVATARCARTSYLNFDGDISYEKDLKLHDDLKESGHWSPFEHCAECMPDSKYYGNFRGYRQYRKLFANENRKINLEELFNARIKSKMGEMDRPLQQC